MLLNELVSRLDDLLQVGRFSDYCPNGLQVQGRAEVRHLFEVHDGPAAVLQRLDTLAAHPGGAVQRL